MTVDGNPTPILDQNQADSALKLDSAVRRKRWLILVAVFVVALGLRCVFLWGQLRHDPLFHHPMMDAQIHHLWAQQVAAGNGLDDTPYFRAPLYYLALGQLYRIFGAEIMVGRLAGCLLGALSCLLLVRLGTLIAGFRVGVTAGLIAALYWPLIYFDSQLLTVGLEIFLDLALLLMLHAARRGTSSLLLGVSGCVWGLSAITRPNVLAIAPVILLWFWLNADRRPRWRTALRHSILVGLGAAMVILPVTLRNRVVGGEWVLIATNGGVNFFIGNNAESDGMTAIVPGTHKGWQGGYEDTHRIAEEALGRRPSEAEVSSYWYGRARQWIVSAPVEWIRLTVQKLRLFWSPFEIGNNQSIRLVAQQSPGMRWFFPLGFPVIVAAAAGGLVLERRRWRSWSLVLGFTLVYMATVVAFFSNARYRLPVVPILILLAAAGIVGVVGALRHGRRMEVAGSLIAAALAAVIVLSNPPPAEAFHRTNEANYYLQLGFFHQTPPPQGPGNDAEAIRCFRRVTVLWPRHVEARMALGNALVRQGSLPSAIEQYETAVDHHPDRLEPRLQLARTYAWSGDFTAAEQQFREAVRLHSESAEAHQGLGCVLGAMGRPTEAVPHLQRALAINPDLVRARQCLERVQGPG